MCAEIDRKHHTPYIIAVYAGEEAAISLDGKVLEGDLPKSKLRLVEAWIVIHHDDLAANWQLCTEGEQIFQIDPLK